MTNYGEKAKELFLSGYNCAQAVVLAFSDVTGLDDDTAAKMSSAFGGGLARSREVCGTVSGAAMVLGLVKGCSDPKDFGAKKAHYALIQDFIKRFKEINGSIICRELLAGVKTAPGMVPEQRSEAYYKKRPCPELVRIAADITAEMINR